MTTRNGSAIAEASRKQRSRFFCPSGLIPPTWYPLIRSASAGFIMAADFLPAAAAIAFRLSS